MNSGPAPAFGRPTNTRVLSRRTSPLTKPQEDVGLGPVAPPRWTR